MNSVILLMAGKGTRMKYEKNKILLPFGNQYLFEIPLHTFLVLGYEVIAVISKEDKDSIVPRLPEGVQYTFGGKTRQESVYNGLKLVTGDYVFIHDAARMWIATEVIQGISLASEGKYPVLAYQPVKDTIKINRNGKLETLNRSELIAASTPQCAPREVFLDVYEKAQREGYQATDDISLIERYMPELEIRLVQANEEDFKVTTPTDYELAKKIWRERK